MIICVVTLSGSKMRPRSLDVLLLLSSLCISYNASSASLVRFAVMVSNRLDLNNTSTVLSAVNDALGFVNNNLLSDGVSLVHSTILTDVRNKLFKIWSLIFFNIMYLSLKCYNLSEAEELVTSLPQTSPPTVALLGGGCSLVTQHIASITKIPIVSMTSYYHIVDLNAIDTFQ